MSIHTIAVTLKYVFRKNDFDDSKLLDITKMKSATKFIAKLNSVHTPTAANPVSLRHAKFAFQSPNWSSHPHSD